jgi:16S rRNA (guanine966-N2)-methyltransferase
MLRVIAGTARRLQLKTIEGMETRPTTDRIKETLFNVLQNELPGCYFLDLFSGSGAIGIEALSRGSRQAYFVENNRKAVICIKDNLQHTHLADKAQVMTMDAISAIRRLEGQGIVFDIIAMDPPYGKELEKDVLCQLSDSSFVGPDTVIVVEADLETDFDYVESLGFFIEKQKLYKTNQHVFLKKIEE